MIILIILYLKLRYYFVSVKYVVIVVDWRRGQQKMTLFIHNYEATFKPTNKNSIVSIKLEQITQIETDEII